VLTKKELYPDWLLQAFPTFYLQPRFRPHFSPRPEFTKNSFPLMSRLLLALVFLSITPLCAHVVLPSIFSDHMVLQRQMKIPVWGTADVGERVTVTLNDQRADTVADANGQWKTTLPPEEAGGPYTLTVAGNDTVTINDVLIGEVWLFAGQSNMEWGTGFVTNHEQEIPAAVYPQIRLCMVPHTVKGEPATDVPASWAACTPESVFKFSGVAYFTGRELYKKLNVPIGLIQVSWSGTNIEGWMPHEALQSDPDFQPLQDRWNQAWQEASAQAKAQGKPAPPEPKPPEGSDSRFSPAGIFNGAVHPLAPFALRGMVWYQGENNALWAFLYRKELKAMITSWRQLWNEDDFPFLVIQLPSVIPLPVSNTSRWAEIRESQAKALDLPNTGLVVTIDLGDALHHDNLHPKNKLDVGLRTALVAEKIAYGMDVISRGPTFKTATILNDSVRVQFDSADGLKTKDGGAVSGFELAGDDQKYLPATGTIDGDSVILHADGLSNPQTIRYDWANYPDGNLYNGANLPARPFRNDDFTLETVNNK
jgi:sialate O-acetylesterase